MKKSVMFSAMICCLLVSFSAVANDVLRVPKDFGTIQQAIDAAPTDAIIQVSAGTYCENLVIARSDVRLHAGPSGRVVLSGSCSPDPIGILITGVNGAVSNVEVKGFIVQGYEAGIVLYRVTDSRVHGNLVEGNVSGSSPRLNGTYTGQGILLAWSHFNEVLQNESRGNGHLGVGILTGSNNLVRANRIIDNVADHGILHRWCAVMIWGTSTGNRFVENEVRGERGMAVMLGGGPTSGNLVAQNRIHGHAFEGIWATASTFGNIIAQNDARGNALQAEAILPLFGYDAYDLDDSSTGANTWRRNLGSCPPESGLCRE
jgi:nitrous oxidase accessory protein NosD